MLRRQQLYHRRALSFLYRRLPLNCYYVETSVLPTRSITIVSRRAVQRLQAATQQSLTKSSNSKTVADDKPWPRSVVIGFYGFMAIVVPYVTGWFLAQHGELRDRLWTACGIPDDHGILQWMRRTFGVVDWAEHPDNGNGNSLLLLGSTASQSTTERCYKLEDEPTLAIRMQQGRIDQMQEATIRVLVTKNAGVQELVEVSGAMLARAESFGAASSDGVAVEFPDDETQIDENDTLSADAVTSGEYEDTTNRLQMAIYSPWHHHIAQPTETTSPQDQKTSTIRLELDRLREQIRDLELAVQQGRSVDEVKGELQQLRAEYRRLQLRRYFW